MKKIRIKKDFDLEKLKELGFENTINNTYRYMTKNSDPKFYKTEVLINPLGKTYENQIVYYIDNLKDNGDYEDVVGSVDILYTLFKMGIVEEVEG